MRRASYTQPLALRHTHTQKYTFVRTHILYIDKGEAYPLTTPNGSECMTTRAWKSSQDNGTRYRSSHTHTLIHMHIARARPSFAMVVADRLFVCKCMYASIGCARVRQACLSLIHHGMPCHSSTLIHITHIHIHNKMQGAEGKLN